MEKVRYGLCHMRLTGIDANFYRHQLKEFAEIVCWEEKDLKAVQFGKQDIRGTESITLIDNENCVPKQKFFTNKWELLGYVRGFLDGRSCLEFAKL